MQNAMAIILARGGSKGLKDKNLRKIDGLTLIERSIFGCADIPQIENVVVSSDSDQILTTAKNANAITIKRPSYLAADNSTSESGWSHAIETLVDKFGDVPSILTFIQCTSPFLDKIALQKSINDIQKESFDCIFAAIVDHGFYWIENDGAFLGLNHSHLEQRKRRQELAAFYKETGQFYTVKTEAYLKSGNRFCTSPKPIITSTPPIDIDTLSDLNIARVLNENAKMEL